MLISSTIRNSRGEVQNSISSTLEARIMKIAKFRWVSEDESQRYTIPLSLSISKERSVILKI